MACCFPKVRNSRAQFKIWPLDIQEHIVCGEEREFLYADVSVVNP